MNAELTFPTRREALEHQSPGMRYGGVAADAQLDGVMSRSPDRASRHLRDCVSCPGADARCHSQHCADLDLIKQQEQERAATHLMLVHELRSPVTASKSLVAALRFKGTEDPLVDSVLGRIENRMDQLLELVNDILLLSGVRSGQPLGQAIDCDLAAETRNVCAPYEEEAAAKGLSMKIDVSAAPSSVRITPQAYRLILSNLASNAVKYTPSGWIKVALRREKGWAVLEVRDSGIGIPPPDMDQLFTEFFRASNARSAHIPGTGLGLAGAKALVDRCGGELDVTSGEQRGSQFTVRLPLCGPSARQVPSPQPRRILQSCLA